MAENSDLICLPVFHVGEENKNIEFCRNKTSIIFHEEDGEWAGNGMYFWDNLYDVNYWLKHLNNVCKNEKHNCVKASLQVADKNMLNLTNNHDIDEFENELYKMCSFVGKENEISKDYRGANINLYYRLYKAACGSPPFTVVKVNGYYKNIPTTSLIFRDDHEHKNYYATNNIRTIYSVLKSDNVINRRVCRIKEFKNE
ncbi:hypothetical protein [Lentilactobacillus otakiensis]|uniref:hypothetical protein n=1 Tax=Lentilactobacillus otakiensis TaxID=481720 RepID=UPI00293CBCF9|nr:hypothetical protein [Lentilactobacillus otakiensis]MDV3518212.1 hypothetical protein [Lentilactobacillus otakiensis]